jgi:hypothetical protein
LNGISNNGTTAGYSINETVQSFTRSARGVFSSPITSRGLNVFAEGVNNSGLVCGYTEDTNDHHGFAHHGFFFQNNILTASRRSGRDRDRPIRSERREISSGPTRPISLHPSIPFKASTG